MILARGPLLMKEKNNRLWEAPWDRRWQQRYFLLQGGQLYVYELRVSDRTYKNLTGCLIYSLSLAVIQL